MTTLRMASGEYFCRSIFKITAIPSEQIIKGIKSEEIVESYKGEFARLLSEIYHWASGNLADMKNISLEIVWTNTPTNNQTYLADITIYFTISSIGETKEISEHTNQFLSSLVRDAFLLLKYDYLEVSSDLFADSIQRSHKYQAIVKHEQMESSNIPFIEAIYSFGTMQSSNNDFSNIINSLSNAPNSIIYFQLIPTRYTFEEQSVLTDYVQKANVASKGVMAPKVGQVSYLQADVILSTFQQYFDQRSGPLFQYNIIVGSDEVESRVLSQLIGVLNSDHEHPIKFDVIDLNEELFNRKNDSFLPWIINNKICDYRKQHVPIHISQYAVNPLFRSMSRIISLAEAAEFFRLPVGSSSACSGLNINESEKISRKFESNLIDSADIYLGNLKSSMNKTLGLGLNDLTKHMFVCGTPGSGKSSFLIGILNTLWCQFNIPFIVIEPAKNEYRALIDTIPDLQVFTPGKDFIAPLMINPFYPPDNVRLSSYKRTLKTAFSAAVSMSTPLDRIFEDAVNNCYSDHGWSDCNTSANGGKIFNITEFIKCFQSTFADIGYVGEASNIGRAGVVRLRGLSNYFDSYSTIPMADLLSKPTVIELAAVENPEEKSLFISLILLSILSYVNSNYSGNGTLHNVILLEEAHVILDQNIDKPGEANPGDVAQTLIKRMLAESRAYGLGMIVADQSPRKVGLDIVALTDVKVAFRLVEKSDREIMADSMGMEDAQKTRLIKLRPGEAFCFFNRMDVSEEIQMPDYRANHGLKVWIPDDSLMIKIQNNNSQTASMRPYPECSLCNICENGCSYECRSISREISRRLFNRYIGHTHDKSVLKHVAINFSTLCQTYIHDVDNLELVNHCVRVNFWRSVRYSSKYNISDDFLKKLIKIEDGDN